MNCQEMNKHWQAFLEGNCTQKLANQIEAHMKECESCSEQLSDAIEQQPPSIKKQMNLNNWN